MLSVRGTSLRSADSMHTRVMSEDHEQGGSECDAVGDNFHLLYSGVVLGYDSAPAVAGHEVL